MKFAVGQSVEVTNPSTIYAEQFRGQRAVISDIREGELFPYEVTFPKGTYLGFAEEELSAVGLSSYLAIVDEIADFLAKPEDDEVNHPRHYTWLPNGIEVIDITENFNFTLGNALKYIMRAGHKDDALTDLRKAAWYINREISRLESA